MTLPSSFKVGSYECFLISIDIPRTTASVGITGYFDLLQAERAVSTVAKQLCSSSVTLERWGSSSRYTCRIDDVELKEIDKWLD